MEKASIYLKSVDNSKIEKSCDIIVTPVDSVSTILKYSNEKYKTAVLNFAS